MKEIYGHYYFAYRGLLRLNLYEDGNLLDVERMSYSTLYSKYAFHLKVRTKIEENKYLLVTSKIRKEIKFAIAENKKD